MASTGPTANVPHAKAKKPRIPCKYKDDLFSSHGFGKPVNGVSVCQFCISFGREVRDDTPAQRADGKRKHRTPNRKALIFEDFSRARIEEHYDFSHSRKYALFKQIVIPQQSAKAVRCFFDSEKVEAYFNRAKPVKWELVTSVEVGALIAELYPTDHMFPADDPQVRLIKALQLVDADEDPSDDDRGEGGVGPHYAATISSRATFLQVVELVKNELSYRQARRSCRFTEKSLP
jgi:hypothetical protein